MPFLIVDQGNAIHRHYEIDATRKSGPVSETHPTKPTEQERSTPIKNPYQQKSEIQAVSMASDIMTKPAYTLDIETTGEDAWNLLESHQIRHLPVVEQEKLVGLITERDLLRYLAHHQHLEDSTASIMSHKVYAATSNTDIRQLAHWMFDKKIGALPIVTQEQKVIGIVTRYDLLKVMSHYGTFKLWA